MNKTDYQTYLNSQTWAATRTLAIHHHGDKCVCGQVADQIHHLNYERVGNERMTDLLPLCETCHSSYHKIEVLRLEGGKNSVRPVIDESETLDVLKKKVLDDYHIAFPKGTVV